MIKHALIAATLLVAPAAHAATVTLDFDDLQSGPLQDVPLATFTEDGLTFGLSSTGSNLGPVIFDTTCVGADCNGDSDLKPVGGQGTDGIAGNVLILQEPGSNVPDDDGSAGSITFTLLAGSAFQLLGFSGVDDATFTIGTVADGSLGSIDNGSGNAFNGATGIASFAPSSVINIGDSFTVTYSGSGGVDSIVLETVAAVPVPASVLLMLTGLGGLAAVRRKRAA